MSSNSSPPVTLKHRKIIVSYDYLVFIFLSVLRVYQIIFNRNLILILTSQIRDNENSLLELSHVAGLKKKDKTVMNDVTFDVVECEHLLSCHISHIPLGEEIVYIHYFSFFDYLRYK